MHRLCTILPILVLLTGCTLGRPLAQHAISYNKTVENAQNEMLLLNVVRAKERMPMYFTAIGGITTSIGYEVESGGLTVTDAGGGSDTWQLGLPSASYSNSPTVQISVLDDEKFTRGTLTPVGADTIYYYWQQGWKTDLLIYLLVESIRLREENDLICPHLEAGKRERLVENDPEDSAEFGDFRKCIEAFSASNCWIDLKPMPTDLGSVPSDKPAPTIAELINAHDKGFVVTKTDSGTVLGRREMQLTLHCTVEGERYEVNLTRPGTVADSKASKVNSRNLEVIFRSPQGVLYYLGEIARAWETGQVDRVPMITVDGGETGFLCPDHPKEPLPDGASKAERVAREWKEARRCVPLFVLRAPSKECSQPLVSVAYRDRKQFVPVAGSAWLSGEPARRIDASFCHPGRSMQALSLASQLISLQRSSEELPAPALVRVVGQ